MQVVLSEQQTVGVHSFFLASMVMGKDISLLSFLLGSHCISGSQWPTPYPCKRGTPFIGDLPFFFFFWPLSWGKKLSLPSPFPSCNRPSHTPVSHRACCSGWHLQAAAVAWCYFLLLSDSRMPGKGAPSCRCGSQASVLPQTDTRICHLVNTSHSYVTHFAHSTCLLSSHFTPSREP